MSRSRSRAFKRSWEQLTAQIYTFNSDKFQCLTAVSRITVVRMYSYPSMTEEFQRTEQNTGPEDCGLKWLAIAVHD